MKVNALIFLTPGINTICQTDNFIHPFLNYITQFYKDNVPTTLNFSLKD